VAVPADWAIAVNAVLLAAAAPAPRIRMSRRERFFEVEFKLPIALVLTDISSPNTPHLSALADIFHQLVMPTGHQLFYRADWPSQSPSMIVMEW
jgi:hypothetical protein